MAAQQGTYALPKQIVRANKIFEREGEVDLTFSRKSSPQPLGQRFRLAVVKGCAELPDQLFVIPLSVLDALFDGISHELRASFPRRPRPGSVPSPNV